MAETTFPRTPLEQAGLGVLGAAIVALYAMAWLGTGTIQLPPRATPAPGLLDELPRGETGRYSAELLRDAFDRLGYSLAAVTVNGEPVPPVLLARMPRDLAQVKPVDARKRLFLRVMLPLVLSVNDAILTDRARLLNLREAAQEGALEDEDAAWLSATSEHYGAATDEVDELLERIDVVPVSLALAQAAEESGWGTSRFARDGNALFGQWTFSGKGLVPAAAGDKTHRIRAFDTLGDAVRAYVHNLNTHAAYTDFRRRRAAMRKVGEPIDGEALAGTLTRYSERGYAYVESLRSIIRVNKLLALDAARLAGSDADATRTY